MNPSFSRAINACSILEIGIPIVSARLIARTGPSASSLPLMISTNAFSFDDSCSVSLSGIWISFVIFDSGEIAFIYMIRSVATQNSLLSSALSIELDFRLITPQNNPPIRLHFYPHLLLKNQVEQEHRVTPLHCLPVATPRF